MSTDTAPPPPRSEAELLRRTRAVAGLSLAELAKRHALPLPGDLRRSKGWVGQLLEAALGASAASLAEPDFRHIGVELKTLPIDVRGLPRESTYVCTVPLEEGHGERWEESWVRRKLARVLWLPVQADPALPLAERRIGNGLLWSPTPDEDALLRRDWEELMELVATGGLEQVSARHGEALQIRPKAANASARRGAVGPDGERVLTNPRGFYLRASFTAGLLRRHYAVAR